MRLPIFHLDAFTTRPFAGNPAAVVPLERWLDDDLLLAVAAENALSETAFLVREAPGSASDARPAWAIRWFTTTVEVDLCGHATLAAGHVVLTRLQPGDEVTFQSRCAGPLAVRKEGAEREPDASVVGARYVLDFPARPAVPCEPTAALVAALGRRPVECLRGFDLVAVLRDEDEVRALAPDLSIVRTLDAEGLVVTAPGRAVDFVSRYFAPQAGLDEDPVTAAAHCALVPYWAARLGKAELEARQVSRRGGELRCQLRGTRVLLTGGVVPYLEGTIEVPGSFRSPRA
jgi:PhzF family phenazine biosynthesis protein